MDKLKIFNKLRQLRIEKRLINCGAITTAISTVTSLLCIGVAAIIMFTYGDILDNYAFPQ